MALGKKQLGESTVYYYTTCGKELGVQNKTTVDLVYGSCDHYEWSHLPEEVSWMNELVKEVNVNFKYQVMKIRGEKNSYNRLFNMGGGIRWAI